MKKTLTLKFIILLLSCGFSQGLIPSQYKLNDSQNSFRTLSSGLQSNGISEIVLQGSSTVWLGTGEGISYLEDSLFVKTVDTLELKNGDIYLLNDGISGIAVYGDQLISAGASGDHLGDFGTGLFFNDGTEYWVHHAQPTESTMEPSISQEIGSGYFEMLPITTHYNNISYDLAMTSEYAWITSWAGGLRRIPVDSLPNLNAFWSPIPLPEDHQLDLLTCDETIFDDSLNVIPDFFLNPRDPISGGNHNHKAFSVIAYSDTVWVGTANGINRGILGENGCVDWVHYSFQHHNLLGNFVVGLNSQKWNNHRIVWAATMNADSYGEQRGVSYTVDDGATWNQTLVGERAYNISSKDSLVLVSSESGLWKAILHHPDDPIVWAKFQPFVEQSISYNQEILTNEVFTAEADHREYFSFPTLWVGTPDGLARLKNKNEMNWDIYRVELSGNNVFAYPNPFSPNLDNVINGNGYVRFSRGSEIIDRAKLSIYNFAMEGVLSFSYDHTTDGGELKWDGRDSNGYLVANGVYFVHLELTEHANSEIVWTDHWVKVLVVK